MPVGRDFNDHLAVVEHGLVQIQPAGEAGARREQAHVMLAPSAFGVEADGVHQLVRAGERLGALD